MQGDEGAPLEEHIRDVLVPLTLVNMIPQTEALILYNNNPSNHIAPPVGGAYDVLFSISVSIRRRIGVTALGQRYKAAVSPTASTPSPLQVIIPVRQHTITLYTYRSIAILPVMLQVKRLPLKDLGYTRC